MRTFLTIIGLILMFSMMETEAKKEHKELGIFEVREVQ